MTALVKPRRRRPIRKSAKSTPVSAAIESEISVRSADIPFIDLKVSEFAAEFHRMAAHGPSKNHRTPYTYCSVGNVVSVGTPMEKLLK